MPERTILVLWNCGMDALCINTVRPGTHGEYEDAGLCRGIPKVEPPPIVLPVLVVGRDLPPIVGQ